ncbi:hypothetical protein [Streptomyces orinoci]|uniref:HTH iclR-type domain-containing protein n=1 Tax=Streptomyces orinoci TaxID=67339 RepID=A0ABV3K625_STRON|nr:hypothetical protein [Streptomyces orinoci]
MSRRQKGRRHRKVNRTPRPVGSSRPYAVRPQAQPPQPRAVAPELGRHVIRTWDGLRSCGPGGASVADLSAAVGYQPRTILKHINGLVSQGLAEQRGDRWFATGEGLLVGS